VIENHLTRSEKPKPENMVIDFDVNTFSINSLEREKEKESMKNPQEGMLLFLRITRL